MLTGKPDSIEEFVKIKSWLLLIFSACLYSQLKFHYKVLYCRCLNKMIHRVDRKMMAASLNKFYGIMWDSFCLNIEKTLPRKDLILKPIERSSDPLKNGLVISEIALRLRDWHVFIWQSLAILNVFNTLTLKQVFCKTKTLLKVGLSPSKNYFYLLQWKPFKNNEKLFLFHLKSSFRSQDI